MCNRKEERFRGKKRERIKGRLREKARKEDRIKEDKKLEKGRRKMGWKRVQNR